ncbi:MAG: hypothetical protein KBS54_04970 [Synergistaceae bacterium]|nr:hypothetical protein [Candidatus Equadaptatus faecalis]
METSVIAKPCGVCVFPRYLKEEVAAFFELRVTNEKSVKSSKSAVFTTIRRVFLPFRFQKINMSLYLLRGLFRAQKTTLKLKFVVLNLGNLKLFVFAKRRKMA